MTAIPTVIPAHETHRAFFREALQTIRKIMGEEYGLTKVSIRPADSGSARLSIPIKITGLNKKGEKVRYFGKILGSSDDLSNRSFQFFKNVFLEMNAQVPIFETYATTEDMARDQFLMMKDIYDLGIPTPRPYGYHFISGNLWLIVMEFIDAKPISEFKRLLPEQIDTVFQYLTKMHGNKIYHGDLKPDNVMIGERIYILDIGNLRKNASAAKKQTYDLACLLCSFIGFLELGEIVVIARKHYSPKELKGAMMYVQLIQKRPDMHFTDETKEELLVHLFYDGP